MAVVAELPMIPGNAPYTDEVATWTPAAPPARLDAAGAADVMIRPPPPPPPGPCWAGWVSSPPSPPRALIVSPESPLAPPVAEVNTATVPPAPPPPEPSWPLAWPSTTVRVDRAGAGDVAGTDQDDATAGAAAGDGDRVVVGAGSAAATHHDAGHVSGDGRSAVAAARQVRAPCVATASAEAAVAAATTTGVLTVVHGVAVGAATTGVAGGAASEVAVRIPVADGVVGSIGGLPDRGAGDAFGLLAVDGRTRGRAVVGVGESTRRGAGPLALHTGTEPEAGHVDRRTIQVEGVGRIEHDDAAGRSVPRRCRRRCGRVQHGGRVLRDPDHLISVLTGGRRGRRVLVRVDEAAVGTAAGEADRRSGDRRDTGVLVSAGEEVGRGVAARLAAGHPVAVRIRVGRVDLGTLHLHDQHQVVDGERRRRADTAAEGHGRAGLTGSNRCRQAGEVAVDNAGHRGGTRERRRRTHGSGERGLGRCGDRADDERAGDQQRRERGSLQATERTENGQGKQTWRVPYDFGNSARNLRHAVGRNRSEDRTRHGMSTASGSSNDSH